MAIENNDTGEFYAYIHRRADTKAPFYVGNGKLGRAWQKYNRTQYWKNIVDK